MASTRNMLPPRLRAMTNDLALPRRYGSRAFGSAFNSRSTFASGRSTFASGRSTFASGEATAKENDAVSPLELFFDLTFIYMIAELSELAHKTVIELIKIEDHGHGCLATNATVCLCGGHSSHDESAKAGNMMIGGLHLPGMFLLSLCLYSLSAWKLWLTEARARGLVVHGGDLLGRVMTFGQMFAFGGMASAAARGMQDAIRFMLVRGSFILGRILLIWSFTRLLQQYPDSNLALSSGCATIRAMRDAAKLEVLLLVVSLGISASSINDEGLPDCQKCYNAGFAVWVVSLLISPSMMELLCKSCSCCPSFLKKSFGNAAHAYNKEHFNERLGLLMIIVLGEVAVHLLDQGKLAFEEHGHVIYQVHYIAIPLAFAPIWSQFWLYFDSTDIQIFDGTHRKTVAVVETAMFFVMLGFACLSTALAMLLKLWTCSSQTEILPDPVAWFCCLCFGLGMGGAAWVGLLSQRRTMLDRGSDIDDQSEFNSTTHRRKQWVCGAVALLVMLQPVYLDHTAESLIITFAAISICRVVLEVALQKIGADRADRHGQSGNTNEIALQDVTLDTPLLTVTPEQDEDRCSESDDEKPRPGHFARSSLSTNEARQVFTSTPRQYFDQ